jgi:hypothetical protein
MSRDQNAGQNRNIKMASNTFEHVEKFKYLGTIVTNENRINDGIKCTSLRENACYCELSLFYLPVSSLKTELLKYVNLGISP